MTTVGTWLAAHPELARRDREVLLCRAAALSRAQVLARPERPLDTETLDLLERWAVRRGAGEPVAYIFGRREFWGLELEVGPGVLVPRPETELLVEAALSSLWERSPDRDLEIAPTRSSRSGDRSHTDHNRSHTNRPQPVPHRPAVLDLGTGSGAVAIALAVEAAARDLPLRLTAADVSAEALAVARRNGARLGVELHWRLSDWFQDIDGYFHLIVSNPPYVAEQDPHLAELQHEPRSALAAGPDGLDALGAIIAGAPAHLEPGGALLLEHGYDQGAAVRALLAAAGFQGIETLTDLAGHERVAQGQWPERSL